MNTFTLKDALEFGWEKTKEHFGYFVVLLLILFASSVVLNALAAIPVIGFIAVIAGQTILNMGLLHIVFAIGRNKPRPSYKELFTTTKPFGMFLGASLLTGLMVLVGTLLLVIPGIIAAIALQFSTYLVIDKNMKAVEAVKESARITKGNRWKLLGVMLLLGILNAMGGLLFGLGLFVSIPMTLMAMVFIYDALTGSSTTPAMPATPAENTLEQSENTGVA